MMGTFEAIKGISNIRAFSFSKIEPPDSKTVACVAPSITEGIEIGFRFVCRCDDDWTALAMDRTDAKAVSYLVKILV